MAVPPKASRQRAALPSPGCCSTKRTNTSSTVQNRSLMNADNPRPHREEGETTAVLQVRAQVTRLRARRTLAPPDPAAAVPATSTRHQQPRRRRARSRGPRRCAAPATTHVAAVADEQRIRRQAARRVDDDGVGDEGEGERPEAAGAEGTRDEQSQREVAEARDALVGHSPAQASDHAEPSHACWSRPVAHRRVRGGRCHVHSGGMRRAAACVSAAGRLIGCAIAKR